MDKTAGQISAELSTGPGLFPALEPFDRRMLDVGDGHRIYVEQCGNARGTPVLVVHGGPGGGCSPMMRRFFDPARYRIILFDQRGCGRSRPHASVENNTTWHLVADMELIRTTLGIERWGVFGGSWGATLSLVYAETHPERVTQLFLRGVFLARQRELDWFYGGGAGSFWPELWQKFSAMVPEAERADMIAAYHRRLFGSDTTEQRRFARMWATWENALASMGNNGVTHEIPSEYALAFARLENHYFTHKAFLEEGQILRDADRIADIPGVIVQGRHDMICPPHSAWELAQAWPAGRLEIIANAGHALSEPDISASLIKATNAWVA